MRILWLTQWQPPAVRRRLGIAVDPGPQAWVDSLAARLAKRSDIELTIATPSAVSFAPFVDGGVGYEGLRQPMPATRAGRIAANWFYHLTPPETIDAATKMVRRMRPDVVHVHGTENGLGLVAGLLPLQPCVISLQGIAQAYKRRYFAGRRQVEIVRLVACPEFLKGRGVVHRYFQLRREATRETRIMREAKCFIGRTAWDRAVLKSVNPNARYYHCDEIMRSEFSAVRWAGREHSGTIVYTTSSALLGKGTEVLLEALALVNTQSDRPVTLRVAGVHPGSEIDRLYRRVATRVGLAGSVVWLGRLDAAALAEELAVADVFAYPSHVDNSPNAVAEAMLVGSPVVATSVGGIPSMIRDRIEGLLVPRGDRRALADGIMRLLDDRRTAARLGATARMTALARHDPQRIAAHTLDIYGDVVAHWHWDASKV